MSLTPSTSPFFPSLIEELGDRAAAALIGTLSPVSAPLRNHLRSTLGAAAGEGASFLADPVFEAIFDWQTGEDTMDDLARKGLLSEHLVDAMAAPSTDPELREYVFPRERYPFVHQVAAWQHLAQPEARSVLVTSGTGSGKTECFLVPILDRLARERARLGRLQGVRALFLYPLNALINSQRDRLRAWCEPFGGDIRFSLYKGDTPDILPNKSRIGTPEEVRDRKTLRSDAPPILVTNSTMLEYMLVRREDRSIITQSQGLLEWVVLDEAHTYLGSGAAETALLLRRVLHAFGTSADRVRFVATSATIGTDSQKANDELRRFLADLAGTPLEQVYVVRGRRTIPDLDARYTTQDKALPSSDTIRGLAPEARFEVLAANAGVRHMRDQLTRRQAMTLTSLTAARLGMNEQELPEVVGSEASIDSEGRQLSLELLDLCTTAEHDGEALLRVRTHLFHRTQGGLWACINPACSGRHTTDLDVRDWYYGAVYYERRERCGHCDSVILDLLLCDECGAEYLAADLVSVEGAHRYIARADDRDVVDDEAVDVELGVEGESDNEVLSAPEPAFRWPRLLQWVADDEADAERVRTSDGSLLADDAKGAQTVRLKELRQQTAGGLCRCARCGTSETRPDELFRPGRRGAPFFLRSIVPVLLKYAPPISISPGVLPAGGRRLLTFTDSRQGTARFALDAQLDGERNYIRSFVYHQVAAARPSRADMESKIAILQEQEDALVGANAESNSALRPMLESVRRNLTELRVPPVGQLPWEGVISALTGREELTKWMLKHWGNLPLAELEARDAAHFCLLREFARRPKRANSLETLGLVAVEYPGLAQKASAPDAWRQRGLDDASWLDFLSTAVTFTVRANSAVQVDSRFLNWMGSPIRPREIVGPDAREVSAHVVRWPTVHSPVSRSRLVQLLARVLDVSIANPVGRATINECLYAAWDQVTAILSVTQNGRVLDLRSQVVLREGASAWLCPITRRVLDRTVSKITPYATSQLPASMAECRAVQMPALPEPFWRRPSGASFSPEEIREWLGGNEEIAALTRDGVWSDISTRVVERAEYYQVGEHSAQQSSTRLQQLEGEFKAGRMNVLSCSTTMEMGVDIGGLSAVAMNNTPPSPSNYLQRAGRAGRRREARAFSLTLCKNTPHGEWVFRRPTWAFTTPLYVSDVALTSERIIQRHINSLALTRFFEVVIGPGDLPKLIAGAFFAGAESEHAPPVAERFALWLLTEAPDDSWLCDGVTALLRHSILEGTSVRRLLHATADGIRDARTAWLSEVDPLQRHLAALGSDRDSGPEQRAVEIQLRRMMEEYLLRELALRSFLPGHGFPTQVVPLVTTTVEDLKAHSSPQSQRDDNLSRSRGYPTRDLAQAIREYAPGSTVVLDGRVLQVDGVTLNWKIPASDTQVREIQALRWAWRCGTCGAAGTSIQLPETCDDSACGAPISNPRRFLEPSGFAVEISYRASNDLSQNVFVPVEQPWVSAGGGVWHPLPVAQLGRFRTSGAGRVFNYSGGQHGAGYAICLRCGRAASMEGRNSELPAELVGHTPLRGGKGRNASGQCTGNDSEWSIVTNIALGVSRVTDVLELQLRPIVPLPPEQITKAAASVGVALRQALAQRIGVEDREIGWTCQRSKIADTGGSATSILLYDTATGGAGFVGQAVRHLPELLQRARVILTCSRQCDSACHACLLTYDTASRADELDRHAALQLLTEEFLLGLAIPKALQAFGPTTEVEYDSMPFALARELRSGATVRIHLGGASPDWDLDEWSLRWPIAQWAAEETRVELTIPGKVLDGLDESVRNRLAAWVEAGQLHVARVSDAPVVDGAAHLLAEVGSAARHVKFATYEPAACVPGPTWGFGRGESAVMRARLSTPMESINLGGSLLAAADLRVKPPGSVADVTIVASDVNGTIVGFGERFWARVLKADPALQAKLATGAPVKRVIYKDRYVASPLAMRLVVEVMAALRRKTKAMAEAEVSLLTREVKRDKGLNPRYFSNDWEQGVRRSEIFSTSLAGAGMRGDLVEVGYSQAEHARELLLEWVDGARWKMRMDQGFGFMHAPNSPTFPFRAVERDQGHTLTQIVCNVSVRNETYLYLFPLEAGVR